MSRRGARYSELTEREKQAHRAANKRYAIRQHALFGKRPRCTGRTKHPLYKIWRGMISRCYGPAGTRHHRLYASRGIKVCERWRKCFEDFVSDVGSRPSLKHSLERENNNGNYEPGNVVWATQKQQMHNTRSNRMLTAFGKTKALCLWAQETGLRHVTIEARIDRLGWPIELALSTPASRANNLAKLKAVKRLGSPLSQKRGK